VEVVCLRKQVKRCEMAWLGLLNELCLALLHCSLWLGLRKVGMIYSFREKGFFLGEIYENPKPPKDQTAHTKHKTPNALPCLAWSSSLSIHQAL
jgi:hypothetical protein